MALRIVALIAALLTLFSDLAGATGAAVTEDGRQKTSALIENLPVGRINVEGNALSPTTFRENATYDSTRICYSSGASIIRAWIYVTPFADSLSGKTVADSAKIVWVGIRPKPHLVALPDSGSTSKHLFIRSQQRINGGPAWVADTTGARWTEAGTAQTTWNRDVWARPLPNEILVPVERPSTTGANGTALPAWTTVDFCYAEMGCFTSPIFSAVLRVFGHSTAFPTAGNGWVVEKDPYCRYQIRVDFELIR
jgi:hypothetical protein